MNDVFASWWASGSVALHAHHQTTNPIRRGETYRRSLKRRTAEPAQRSEGIGAGSNQRETIAMPRRSVAALPDPMRRRIGDTLIEKRAYHLAQESLRHKDATGLAVRVRSEMRRIRSEARWHAEQAADALEVLEALA